MVDNYVYYFKLDDSVYRSFIDYCIEMEIDPPVFTHIDGDGWYLLQEGNEQYADILLDWDEEDNVSGGGSNWFIADRWNISGVPSVMWP